MKKTFELTHPKIKLARRVDAVKHEVKKYLKRERKKTLPEGTDYWDFDCKFGNTEAEAKSTNISEMNKLIDQAVAAERTDFYIQILAKAKKREFVEPEYDEEDED
jgi:hypothetical protein